MIARAALAILIAATMGGHAMANGDEIAAEPDRLVQQRDLDALIHRVETLEQSNDNLLRAITVLQNALDRHIAATAKKADVHPFKPKKRK